MQSMILDFIGALFYIGIVYVVGQCTVKWLYKNVSDRSTEWLSFAVGFSKLTILSTFLYFTCHMSVQVIRIVWLLLGGASVFLLIKRKLFTKSGMAVLGCVTGLWIVMLLPGLIGGDQYYVYRGNCTDQQTYVEETVAMSMHPIGWYESRTEEQIGIISDVLWRGYQWAVKDRPSAGLMIAVLRWNSTGEIYWVVYLFRMFIQAMILPSLFYLFRVTAKRPGKQRVWTAVGIAAAALYCAGFWGQIQYDIDAVSQMSSIAVLVALTAVFFQYVQEMADGKEGSRKQYMLLILLAAAGLALYLESALVHGALYLLSGLFLFLREKKKPGWKQSIQMICVPVLSLLIVIAANYRITGFLRGQIFSSVSDGRQAWADYFNQWWLGRYGIDDGRITGPVSRLANCILSVSGMYNMTVNYDRYYGVAALALTGMAVLLACLVLFCLVKPVFEKTERPVWMLWTVVLTGAALVIGMCICKKNWSAGKLLYYVSPYWYAFLCMPALQIENRRKLTAKLAIFLAAVMLFSNAKMVLARVYDTKVNWACSGYRGNYPSDMIPGLKHWAKFTFDTRDVAEADGVIIRDLEMVSDHQFYLQYLKVKLTCAEIPFVPENDVGYYGNKIDVSGERSLEGNILTLEAVKDESGRYEVKLTADQ